MSIEHDIDRDMGWLEAIDAPSPSEACLAQTRARVAGELAVHRVDDLTRARIKRAVRAELGGNRSWTGWIAQAAAAAAIVLLVALGWSAPGGSDVPQDELLLVLETRADPELSDIASDLKALEAWQDTVDLMLLFDGDDTLQDTLAPYYLTSDVELSDDPV